jgi:hypothetical protein
VGEGGQDRARLGNVDHHRAVAAAEEIGVVVPEAGNGDERVGDGHGILPVRG